MLQTILNDIHFTIYLIVFVLAYLSLTWVIYINPPSKLSKVFPFYVAILFIPIILILAYPYIIFAMVKESWDKRMKAEAMRVKKNNILRK